LIKAEEINNKIEQLDSQINELQSQKDRYIATGLSMSDPKELFEG